MKNFFTFLFLLLGIFLSIAGIILLFGEPDDRLIGSEWVVTFIIVKVVGALCLTIAYNIIKTLFRTYNKN